MTEGTLYWTFNWHPRCCKCHCFNERQIKSCNYNCNQRCKWCWSVYRCKSCPTFNSIMFHSLTTTLLQLRLLSHYPILNQILPLNEFKMSMYYPIMHLKLQIYLFKSMWGGLLLWFKHSLVPPSVDASNINSVRKSSQHTKKTRFATDLPSSVPAEATVLSSRVESNKMLTSIIKWSVTGRQDRKEWCRDNTKQLIVYVLKTTQVRHRNIKCNQQRSFLLRNQSTLFQMMN